MQKALLIGAFVFAYGSAALARERALPYTPSPGDTPSVGTLAAVAPRPRTAGTSRGAETSSFDNERWLDRALDRKLWICRGC
jgi:hypothetical protein